MNKNELIQKVRAMKDITSDEKAYLIDLIKTKKKYGLVWEDKPEDVEEQLRRELPVFKELKDKAIISDNPEAPNHILIEGDNLHALTALTYTHKGKVDVIYIDPPYNTGNNDFIYNDRYVDSEDSYRHSKWLSFMDKRLRIAEKLLKDSGVLIISIDDVEQAQLKLLCSEIYGEQNIIGTFPTIMNLKGNQGEFAFAGTHEYTLIIAKNKSSFLPNELPFDCEELETWSEDEIGFYKKGAIIKATGTEGKRENRPYMFYPILVDDKDNVSTITESEYLQLYNREDRTFNDNYLKEVSELYENKGFTVVVPKNGDEFGRWRWGYNPQNIRRFNYDVIVNRTKNGVTLYKKQRPQLGDIPSKKPKSILYRPEYSSGNGTEQLKQLFGTRKFDNPKPLDLILDFLRISSNLESCILDFFAGSGTTLHATMELNSQDGGKRQCLLVTNNENNIAEMVTYERNKKAIQGYINSSGLNVEGLSQNTLRYFQTDTVPSNINEQNRRLLTERSTELICIKEDCYTDVTKQHKSIKPQLARIFTNRKGKYLIMIYHSFVQYEVIQELIEIIPTLETEEKVKVYSFSPEKETIDEEFISIIDKIESVPLPESIYNTYKQCFRAINLDRETAVEPEKTDDNVYLI